MKVLNGIQWNFVYFQAITWILELCEVMANTHTNMGKTHEEAEKLQEDHKKFETTAQVSEIFKSINCLTVQNITFFHYTSEKYHICRQKKTHKGLQA